MADKKISELPFGQLDSSSIIPIVNAGTTSQTTFGNMLSQITGGGDSLWSAGTGTNSVVQNNSGSIANGHYSTAIGLNTIANGGTGTVEFNLPITVTSGITITLSDPNTSQPAVVLLGDVYSEWADYIGNYCSEFTIYNDLGDTQQINVDCSYYDYYYDAGTDSTYIVDTTISADTYTMINGNTFVYEERIINYPSYSEGIFTTSSDIGSHAEGFGSIASGNTSHAEGYYTQATGDYSHAEGYNTQANVKSSHAEGDFTQANGSYGSHAEGSGTIANGSYGSHAEGQNTTANGSGSHSEGQNTTANGNSSHAEGDGTTANGDSSHAEGRQTIANGYWSHAGGYSTESNGNFSFVHGNTSYANNTNTIVLGANITGTDADKTYIDGLNIKTLGGGTSVNNLGVDSAGNVVTGSAGSIPYKVYTALLTQGGTSAPTAIVLENTIGAISFVYNSTGYYSAVSSGLFTVNKTACFFGESNGNTTLIVKGNTENLVTVISQSPGGTFINDSISKATIEIRVYN